MSKNKVILNLLSEGYSIQEIAETLNISPNKLSAYLRVLTNKGFNFHKKYYADGTILYTPNHEVFPQSLSGTPIYTEPSTDEITLIAISDLHFGNQLENPRALDTIYNYCINNNIHIIINTGDIIDALSFGFNGLKKYDNYADLIDKSFRKYPQDNSILNFTILGNHDLDALIHIGQNIAKYLENYRPDIIPIGIGEGELSLKNSSILIKHPLKLGEEQPHKHIQDYAFVLRGHRHQTVLIDSGVPQIFIPSLSNLKFHGNELPPEALKITIKFNNGHIHAINVSQLIIKGKVYPVNNLQIDLKEGKHHHDDKVKYEETYKKRVLRP